MAGIMEVRVGLLPDVGGCSRLPAVVGLGNAKELIMTGKVIDGREAHRIGFANRIAPADGLSAATDAFANELLACAPRAVGLAKRVMDAAAKPALALTLEQEVAAQETLAASEDFAEGARLLREARPGFRGALGGQTQGGVPGLAAVRGQTQRGVPGLAAVAWGLTPRSGAEEGGQTQGRRPGARSGCLGSDPTRSGFWGLTPPQKCEGPGCRGPGPVAKCRGRVGGTHMCRKPAPAAEFGLYPDPNCQTPYPSRSREFVRQPGRRAT